MLSTRSPITRIPPLRPLRPPSNLRPFTSNTQLLLLATRHTHPRPQLPYLYQSRLPRQTLLGPNHQIARLFSNETRQYVREQVWLATKWTGIIWAFGALALLTYAGIVMETVEHKNPTPEEWSWRTRYCLRAARELMDEEGLAAIGEAIDWARVSSFAESVQQRCEDPKFEGRNLGELGEGGEEILIPGVGKAGFDISGKSWPWRSAYFEALMICALAAEHLEGKVFDKTNHVVYDKEFVVGPSNPNPRPKTQWMSRSPREEDVTEASPPPTLFYMRILTGRGFTTKQKMDAARAYANWLEFKGLPDSAREMYRWSLDIAKAGLHNGVDPESVVDRETSILKQSDGAYELTPNIVRAATDMAIHYARNDNVSAALPILLSVLRARRTAPVSPFPPPTATPVKASSGIATFISAIIQGSKFPSPPPSGDDPIVRSTDQPTCEDSELMLYIGEIIYAASPDSSEGLGWTRQAVMIADGNLALASPADEDVESNKCKECLVTGVGNWDAMLSRMMERVKNEGNEAAKSWVSFGGKGKAEKKMEELQLDRRRLEVVKERMKTEGRGLQI